MYPHTACHRTCRFGLCICGRSDTFFVISRSIVQPLSFRASAGQSLSLRASTPRLLSFRAERTQVSAVEKSYRRHDHPTTNRFLHSLHSVEMTIDETALFGTIRSSSFRAQPVRYHSERNPFIVISSAARRAQSRNLNTARKLRLA